MKSIIPYKRSSQSAKLLARLSDTPRWPRKSPRSSRLYINWGSTQVPGLPTRAKLLNKPEAIKRTTNKLSFFEAAAENRLLASYIPPFTSDQAKARSWQGPNHLVVVRRINDIAERNNPDVNLVVIEPHPGNTLIHFGKINVEYKR